MYLLIALKNQKNANGKELYQSTRLKGPQIPFILIFGLAIVPIAAASYYVFAGLNINSIYSMIVAFGMTLTFMYGFVNVPLSIYHKKMEERTRLPFLLPFVTVIVPAYNEERTIEKTIASVVEADYPYKELIVVDDGSTDGTYGVAARALKRITAIPSSSLSIIKKANGGKSSAL